MWATGSDVTGNDVTGSHVTGRNVTGSDVIFPFFFLTILVVQNVPLFVIRFTASHYSFGIFWSLCCLSFDLRLLIIPLVSSSLSCKGTFCTTTIVRKQRRKITSLPDMTSLSVMRLASLPAMTSLPGAHLSQIMMAYRSSKQSSTDQTPNIPPPPPPPPPFTDYVRYVTVNLFICDLKELRKRGG